METLLGIIQNFFGLGSPTRLEGMEIVELNDGVYHQLRSPTRLEGMEMRFCNMSAISRASLRPALRGWKSFKMRGVRSK